MFPYIGIMADEEPKDSISPSGLYNSSESTATKNDFSTPLIGGLSEFTFMMWVYVPTAITYITPYIEKGAYLGDSMPFIIQNGSIGSSITNSNGGRTVVDYFTTVPKDEFIHVAVTGSVSNNRIRMYLNGSLGQSAVMTYANDVSTSSFLSLNQTGFSVSQINIFNRELSESEVAEHYVYDDDLLFAGVLGYDAMTASQRDGLVYSSSYTDTISIAGNEFTDKSGNGVTLSPQPTLTGQQIYVYTDANDLPNSGGVPVIYSVNSSTYNGSTSFIEAPAPLDTSLNIGTQEFSTLLWMKSTNTSNVMQVINCDSGSGSYYDFYTFDNGGTPTAEFRIIVDRIQIDTTSLLDGSWHLVGLIRDNTGTQGGANGVLSIVIDGVLQTPTLVSRVNNLNSVNAGTTSEPITFGRRSYTNNQYFDGSLGFPSIHVGTVLTPAQVLAEYNAGIPKCLEDSPNNATITEAWDLGAYTNSRGSLIGLKGVQDLTTETSITYLNQGLSVECGGTPTAPSNALPSNLPTIL
jgi:hypothetical protein